MPVVILVAVRRTYLYCDIKVYKLKRIPDMICIPAVFAVDP